MLLPRQRLKLMWGAHIKAYESFALHQFSVAKPTAFAVDSKKRLVVCDQAANQVYLLDEEGKLIRRLGRSAFGFCAPGFGQNIGRGFSASPQRLSGQDPAQA